MNEYPSKQQLILLVNPLCEIQDRILSLRGMPDYIQRPIADKVEPLKAPMFFVWERLGYGSSTALRLAASMAIGWHCSAPSPPSRNDAAMYNDWD